MNKRLSNPERQKQDRQTIRDLRPACGDGKDQNRERKGCKLIRIGVRAGKALAEGLQIKARRGKTVCRFSRYKGLQRIR